MPNRSLAAILTLSLIPLVTAASQAPAAPSSSASRTQVVILGTGTPVADPDTSGPAVAIVVNGAAYLVGCGPGVVRRAAAAERKGIPALKVTKIKVVFITHLHSDHTLGYPDLIFSPWVLGRKEPVESYGPRGLQDMTDYVEKAWAKDIDVRTNGIEHGNRTGCKVHVHEIQPGIIFKDANVMLTAFLVAHGSWDQAFGYRFDTADRSIVLSGDTAPTDAVVKACHGCDILLHEVYNEVDPSRSADWLKYLRAFHTSTFELAKIATEAKPGLLVLYHQGYGHPTPEGQILAEIKGRYSGKVAYAHDLDVD